MPRNIPQFLIAAPTSGTGKTTVSRLLMTLLSQKQLRVQPYKCGPDYIDTKYHEKACGTPSYNLDLFMASQTHVRQLYNEHAADADVCIVEGMMGLFDGYDRSMGSSAEIAKTLCLPVVLVVNAKSAAYSLAAMIKGYMEFDRQVQIAGVIFNHVGSNRHEEMLREVCSDLKLACFGCLHSCNALKEESRHLGLDFSNTGKGKISETELQEISKQLDIDLLLQLTERSVNAPDVSRGMGSTTIYPEIWVARNEESFSFIYAEHLDWLKRHGKVTFFDPEDDNAGIPTHVDLLYLPGGYPENRARQLSSATKMMQSIKDHIARGGYTLAECGGMIYLASFLKTNVESERAICDTNNMVGVLPIGISACKGDTRLSLGYRSFTLGTTEMRGHEFHYSQIVQKDEHTESCVQVFNAKGKEVDTAVFRHKNLVASYMHLYWGETGIECFF